MVARPNKSGMAARMEIIKKLEMGRGERKENEDPHSSYKKVKNESAGERNGREGIRA